MASWRSAPLHVSYDVVGWIAFICWSVSFYPQILLNYRRKSVVGMNFDYMVLNLVKQTWYFVYNLSLYFSSTVQKQYHDKYGIKEMIPVAVNDVAFSAHAILLSAVPVFQIAIYERGNQKVSKIAIGIMVIMWSSIAVCFFIALPKHHWLWLVSILNVMQVILTVIKYVPQAVMNFLRKSTEGWSVGFTLLDFAGSVATYGQMVMQSIDQGSWKNVSGNIGKVLVALVSILFDIIFMCQHYLLYPAKHNKSETSTELENSKPVDQPQPEHV
ncbi:cystinosin homolog [Lotus japonicus]|uniref:cystinosin homolog n=1 Tax=Lotus japonicus TaxID=34305 RepID=UPI00258A89E4|nr:cystinosin homolog [Lotus japonicus]